MTSSTDFHKISEDCVRRFLHSVVAVDDNMSFGAGSDTFPTDDDIDALVDPDDEPTKIITPLAHREVESTKSKSKIKNHPFDYQALAEAFAKDGIACCGLLAKSFDVEERDIITASSRKADITILDWDMQSDSGQFAIEIIKSIITSDVNSGGRLRLLSIYTGENVDVVITKLNNELKKKYNSIIKNNDSIFIEDNHALEQWCIVVISKDIYEKDLPNVLIKKFTSLTAGLLSNAALSCISEIREKTHSILTRYNNKLDTAYVSHILNLITSRELRPYAYENAHDYAVDLISEEIRSTLQISEKLKKSLSKETLSHWPVFHYKRNNCKDFLLTGKKQKELSVENLSAILSADSLVETQSAIERASLGKKEYLSQDGEEDKKLMQLCSLEITRRNLRYHSNIDNVSLKQGTLLLDNDNMVYLCIQPLCDSVRLHEKANFLFIKGTIDENNYNLLIEDADSGFFKIKMPAKASNIVSFAFLVEPGKGVVIGRKHDTEYLNQISSSPLFITDAPPSKLLKWIGEIKTSHAQKITTDIVGNLSRIGLDQHEWLRVKSKDI
ncbi:MULTISPECIES: response regulator receiver domain [Pantoea]|uniref:response regulator receiver domain n=1 Tax=Pantoea TaxID=53335 RepID=UPI0026959FF1